ncbi:transposase [Lysinibacillus sp. NPDC056220]|uniref:transposase n=1 Tax=Lysinibacillus sp. NPDC056220 TaxID=3398580 RepID=UPI003BF60F29
MDGEIGLEESTSWNPYSKELKLAAVQDYLSGQYSLKEVTRKYKVSDKSVLRNWIQKYNSHRELKDTGKGMTNSMTKNNDVRRKNTDCKLLSRTSEKLSARCRNL